LDEVWLDESERRDWSERLCRQRELTEERERSKRIHLPIPALPPDNTHNDDDGNDQPPPLMGILYLWSHLVAFYKWSQDKWLI
jgi:hypothetical protein